MKILDKASLILCVLTIGLHQWLSGLYSGVAFGAQLGGYLYPNIKSDKGSFWISDSDPYMHLVNFGIPVAWSLLALSIMLLFRRNVLWKMVGLVPIGLSIFSWYVMRGVYQSHVSDPDKYIDAMREVAGPHNAVFVFLIALLILQLASIVIHVRSSRVAETVLS